MSTIGKEIGRKLSVKELGWDKPAIQQATLNDRENPIHLVRFVGAVTSLKPYKTQDGETGFGLMGAFEGTSSTGETKDGSVLYLPGYVNDAIVAVFNADESITAIKIAFDVYAKYDADAATSYVFSVNDLLNTGNDTVDEVKEAIKALPMPKALPAPKK